MSKRVVVVDYGLGNLYSVCRSFEKCGAKPELTADPAVVAAAERVVLPGVGAFGAGIAQLKARGLLEALHDVAQAGRPLLGICLGMQLLFDVGEEFGLWPGLGLIPGPVKAIPTVDREGDAQKVPHIGWTALALPADVDGDRWQGTLLDGIQPGAAVYFVHSFTGYPTRHAHRLADADYGGHVISAAVVCDNVAGTQFHPEKSGPVGLRIIENFLRF